MTHPIPGPLPPPARGPWRVRVIGRQPFGEIIREAFADDPSADCVLACVAGPVDADAAGRVLEAARTAIRVGRLVVITHGDALAGFCRSLHAEHPDLGVTLLRVQESEAGLWSARRYAAADCGTYREIVLADGNPPTVPCVEPVTVTGTGATALGPADVVLLTGGCKGRGLACAEALGNTGAAIGIIGAGDPASDPAVRAGLERLRRARACAAYECADIADRVGTRAAIQRLQERLGPVTAVVHASGSVSPRRLAGLSARDTRELLAANTAGLVNALAAVRPDRLRVIVTLGAATGHDGAAGQCHRALASGVIREQAQWHARRLPGCRVLHVDWPAWLGPGLTRAVEEAGRLLIRLIGTSSLPAVLTVQGRAGLAPARIPAARGQSARSGEPAAACRFLEKIRVHYPGVELVADATLGPATDPYLADYRLEGPAALPAVVGLEAMAQAAAVLAGQPLRQATGLRLASPVAIAEDGTAQIRICALHHGDAVETVLRSAVDGYQTDHFRAVFPVACAAPAGAVLSDASGDFPGRGFPASAAPASAVPASPALVRGVPTGTFPGVVPGGTVPVGTVAAGVVPAGAVPAGVVPAGAVPVGVVPPALSAGVVPAGGPATEGPHRGVQGSGLLDLMTTGIVDGSDLYGPLCAHTGRFRRVAFMPSLTARSCRALVRGADHVPWFGPDIAEGPLVLGSPAVNDAAIHALQACVPHRRLVPAGCESVTASGLVVAGAVEVRARERRATKEEYVWDVEAVDSDGRTVVAWAGLRLTDAGPRPRTEPWSPTLLAVYLERRAAALLGPGLRVTVLVEYPRELSCQCARDGSDSGRGLWSDMGAAVNGGSDGACRCGDSYDDPGRSGKAGTGIGGAASGIGGAASGIGGAASGIGGAGAGVGSSGISSSGIGGAGSGTGGNGPGLSSGLLYAGPGLASRACRSHLDGLTLTIEANGRAACDWQPAEAGRHPAVTTSPDRAALHDALHERCGEPSDTVGARMWAAVECLAKAGLPADSPLVLDAVHDDGWVLLRAGDAMVASTVVAVSGVASPLAVALLTASGQQDKAERAKAERAKAERAKAESANGSQHGIREGRRSPAN